MADSRGKHSDTGLWNAALQESAAPPQSLIPLSQGPMYRSGTVLSRSAPDLESFLPPLDAQKAGAGYLSSTALHPSQSDLPPLTKELPPLTGMKPLGMTTSQLQDKLVVHDHEVSMEVDSLEGWVPPAPMVADAVGVQELPRTHIPHQCIGVTTASPQEILAALPAVVLKAAGEVHLKQAVEEVYSVKGEVVVSHCMAGFALDVYAHEGGTAVEFRRTYGDHEAWHAFFTAATAQCRVQYPDAHMLGGWHGGFPEKSSPSGPTMAMAALPPLPMLDDEAAPEAPPSTPQVLSPPVVDEVEHELKAHTEFSGDAVAELAQAVDEQVVGAVVAAANVGLVLHHASLVSTLIQSVLRYTHDAPAVRGALFVLHRCCEDVAAQRRFIAEPLEIMTKLLPLLEGNHIVVQHALRLLSRLAPAVDASVIRSALDVSSAHGQKWRRAINAACRDVAQYAQGTDSLVTEEMLATVRRLVPAQ